MLFPNLSEKLSRQRLTKLLFLRLPILSYLKTYSAPTGVADLIAGTSVGLVLIPQGIAYAVVADLPPEYGLYSSVMGCFIYLIFGTSPELSNAPAAILALMTGIYGQGDLNVAIFQSFMGGILIVACGVLQLGFVINFISMPVISGFASAASIQIASGQLNKLLGLNLTGVVRSGTGLGVVDSWVDTFGNIQLCRWQDALLGLFCVTFLFFFRAVNKSNWFSPADGKTAVGCQAFWNKLSKEKLLILKRSVWFFCTARNALIIVICILVTFIIEPEGSDCHLTEAGCVFSLTGHILPGLPSLQLPAFLSPAEVQTSFSLMVAEHMPGAALIALIAVLQNIAIAKSFAGSRSVDANQEMVALGLSNFAGSFIGSMPIGGSFSRCAVNAASGVKTPIGGLYSGIIVILCLAFLMPACALIPSATLGAVVFCGVVFTIEYQIIKPIWNSKRMDLLPGLSTFFVCLFYRLEFGIAVGVLIQMSSLVYSTARTRVEVEVVKASVSPAGYVHITPHQNISFPSVSHVRNIINKAGKSQDSSTPVVIDCSRIDSVDFTAAKGMKAMLEDFARREQKVFWLNMDEGVENTFTAVCNIDKISTLHELNGV